MSESAAPATGDMSFEEALERFDGRLRALEEGRLSLEDAILAAEQASVYLRVCEERLEAARRRVEVRAEPGAPGPLPEEG